MAGQKRGIAGRSQCRALAHDQHQGASLETADKLLKESIKCRSVIRGEACYEAFASQRENIGYVKDPATLIG